MLTMRHSLTGAAGAAALMFGVTLGGFSSAAAQPIDYGTLPVDPNAITDSTAWVATAPVLNPQGQPGVTAVYTHRDGSREVADTILVLNDPQGAMSALTQGRAGLGADVVNAATQPAPVGTDGMIATGTSADNTQSVAVLTFVEGNTFTTIEFEGPLNDPAPIDLVTEYGKMQAGAIAAALSA